MISKLVEFLHLFRYFSNRLHIFSLDGFQVISKRQLKGNDQQNYERLQKSLTKVKQWEKENKDLHQDNNDNVQRYSRISVELSNQM